MLKRARIVPLNEAEELDIRYWKEAVPEEKRDTLQALREMLYFMKNENRRGLQGIFRIIKQA
jgi:hypothetical protein